MQRRDCQRWYVSTWKVTKMRLNVYAVNFLGPEDQYVVSGSDDGNWFIWDKKTQKLHDILEGDSSVVNVIEGHPYLPIVAVSGIDTTVKVGHTISTENGQLLINHADFCSQLWRASFLASAHGTVYHQAQRGRSCQWREPDEFSHVRYDCSSSWSGQMCVPVGVLAKATSQ
jgi:WD40 repeat protein